MVIQLDDKLPSKHGDHVRRKVRALSRIQNALEVQNEKGNLYDITKGNSLTIRKINKGTDTTNNSN